MKIGDFARLAGVTVRTLRHYHDERLLSPADVDPDSGYRSYTYDQLADLDRILALRDLGFSLAQTRALLAGGADAIEACLVQHRRCLVAEVARQTARLRRLTALQRAVAAGPRSPELGVRMRSIDDVRALTVRSRPDSVSANFEEIEARAARDRIDRSPFLLLHGPRDLEICVPVRAACRLSGAREIRGAPLAASITYSGSYAQTAALGARMATWLRHSGLRAAGPLREVYHRFGADQRGYGLPERRLTSNPDRFVTELQLPAEEI